MWWRREEKVVDSGELACKLQLVPVQSPRAGRRDERASERAHYRSVGSSRLAQQTPSLRELGLLEGRRSTMDRLKFTSRRVQNQKPPPLNPDPPVDEEEPRHGLKSSGSNVSVEDQEPSMGVKVRRNDSLHREYKGDYLHVASHPLLMKILDKQGDREVLFADRVLKFTESGKIKQRILLITDFAIYIVAPETNALKRRIALAAVDKLCISELSDNFLAIIIPSEYDLLIASIRKSEIVTVLGQVTQSTSEYELQVLFSNRFEYHAAAEVVKEIHFEEVEGNVSTRIVRK